MVEHTQRKTEMDNFFLTIMYVVLGAMIINLFVLGTKGLIDGATYGEVQDRFVRLGNMTGMSFEEITNAISRNPTSIHMSNGIMFATWSEHNDLINTYGVNASFYSITLMFVDNMFKGIQSENAVTLR